jgi:hypothetical protein
MVPSVHVHTTEGDLYGRDRKKCSYSECRGVHKGGSQNQQNSLDRTGSYPV